MAVQIFEFEINGVGISAEIHELLGLAILVELLFGLMGGFTLHVLAL